MRKDFLVFLFSATGAAISIVSQVKKPGGVIQREIRAVGISFERFLRGGIRSKRCRADFGGGLTPMTGRCLACGRDQRREKFT